MMVGRWDWWNIKQEHTRFEWALQLIAEEMEPLGESRADMRHARNTTQIISALLPGMSDAEVSETSNGLRNYLVVNNPDDDRVLTPEEAAELKRRSE